jgi:hypothetical protein
MKMFIVYARENRRIKEKILSRIEIPLLNHGVEIWHDGRIPIASNWEEVIKQNLSQSSLFLFVVSKDFFNSSFIKSVEFKNACEQHQKRKSLIMKNRTILIKYRHSLEMGHVISKAGVRINCLKYF